MNVLNILLIKFYFPKLNKKIKDEKRKLLLLILIILMIIITLMIILNGLKIVLGNKIFSLLVNYFILF